MQRTGQSIYPDLREKVAIITAAAGGGIGRATAFRLGALGMRIAVSDKSEKRVASLGDELRAEGVVAIDMAADVTSQADVASLVDSTMSAFGQIDVLHNNAGIGSHSQVSELTANEWRATIETNAEGTFLCTKAVLQHMLAVGSGVVINMSSYQAYAGAAGGAAYSAAKAAIIGFTKSLALEVGSRGIRANCIAPGVIFNPFLEKAVDSSVIEALVDQTVLKRAGHPEEVANLVSFLASDDSAYITGAVIPITGGLYLP